MHQSVDESFNKNKQTEGSRAWLALLNANVAKGTQQKRVVRYYPGDNIIELLSFFSRYHPRFATTRQILQDMSLTFQQENLFVEGVNIPKSASTIERLLENLHQPPISLV